MTISVAPSEAFEVTFDNAAEGLVGVLGVKIRDGAGTIVTARTTAGIVEEDPGVYTATMTAPAAGGQYTIVADTGGADPVYLSESLLVTAVTVITAPADITPTVAEVALLLRARTRVNGQLRGTFDDDTSVTAADAQDLIDVAAGYVDARLRGEVPESQYAVARHVIALYAAILIEQSYFPEQTTEDATTFNRLQALFESHLVALNDALADVATGPDLRIGSIAIMSPTAAAYYAVYGEELPTTFTE